MKSIVYNSCTTKYKRGIFHPMLRFLCISQPVQAAHSKLLNKGTVLKQLASNMRGFPFTLRTNTIGHLWESKSHKWPTVLVRKAKGKPCNFEASLCGSLYSTYTTSFQPYAFYNKQLQTLFKDQLVRSKATCSFKTCVILSYSSLLRTSLKFY